MAVPTQVTLDPTAEVAGRILAGRYRLIRQVGVGGFGVVYLGEDARVQRRVAIKVLSPTIAFDSSAVDRFQREACAAGQIGHEGIVAVTDFDHAEDGTPFLVMEYVDGVSLAELLAASAPLAPRRALVIASRIAQALAAAHDAGILHRDLKPANVLLTTRSGVEDVVKVVDFGVSKFLGEGGGASLTGHGQIIGTPRYMSPEQGMSVRGLDGRTDVYSLGVILFEMLTGKVPFHGSTHYELVNHKLRGRPPLPSSLVPGAAIPPGLDEVALRALAPEPDRRFPSMGAFDAALRAVLDEAVAAAAGPPAPEPSSWAVESLVTVDTEWVPAPAPLAAAALAPAAGANPTADDDDLTVIDVAPPPARSRLRALVAAGGVAVAGAALVAFVATGSRGRDEVDPGERRTAVAEPIAGDGAEPEAVVPEIPAEVEVLLVLDPPDATAELDGVIVRENPLVLPRSEHEHELVVTAPGYEPARRSLRALTSGEVRVRLDLESAPAVTASDERPSSRRSGRRGRGRAGEVSPPSAGAGESSRARQWGEPIEPF